MGVSCVIKVYDSAEVKYITLISHHDGEPHKMGVLLVSLLNDLEWSSMGVLTTELIYRLCKKSLNNILIVPDEYLELMCLDYEYIINSTGKKELSLECINRDCEVLHKGRISNYLRKEMEK